MILIAQDSRGSLGSHVHIGHMRRLGHHMAARKAWHISSDGRGSGGFLAPPGHYSLRYTLWHGSTYDHADVIGGLGMALDEAGKWDIPDSIIKRAQAIAGASVLVESEWWQRHTYAYFRTMYAPEGGDRNVSRAISDPSDSLPPERHLGFLMCRSYFPDHVIRHDLITGRERHYGSYPCVHCGHRVQYEARIDGFAVFGKDTPCVEGQSHSW